MYKNIQKPILNFNLDNKNRRNKFNQAKLLNLVSKALKIFNKALLAYVKWNGATRLKRDKNIKLINKEYFKESKLTKIIFLKRIFPAKPLKILKKIPHSNNISLQSHYIKTKTKLSSKIVKILATSNNYNFNTTRTQNIYDFLQRSFISMSILISKPIYVITPNKIVIQLFYFLLKGKKSILILKNNNKLKIICNILTRFFRKPIEFDLVRLHYPYFNANILVNLLGIFINKIKLRRIVKKFISKSIKNHNRNNLIFNKSNQLIPSELTGIKIKVAGRLLTQRVVPRKTIKIINRGALSRNKTMFVETARFTNKNKRGAFSLTVSIGQRLRSTVINPSYNNQIRTFQTTSVKCSYLTKLER